MNGRHCRLGSPCPIMRHMLGKQYGQSLRAICWSRLMSWAGGTARLISGYLVAQQVMASLILSFRWMAKAILIMQCMADQWLSSNVEMSASMMSAGSKVLACSDCTMQTSCNGSGACCLPFRPASAGLTTSSGGFRVHLSALPSAKSGMQIRLADVAWLI